MSQPALAASAPAPFLRRAFDWWIAQVKHALPPTIFFFVGFNLILWTKRLILEEHGVEFSGFLTATLAALLSAAARVRPAARARVAQLCRWCSAPLCVGCPIGALHDYTDGKVLQKSRLL